MVIVAAGLVLGQLCQPFATRLEPVSLELMVNLLSPFSSPMYMVPWFEIA
jgi:hypothetical protein